MKEEQKMAVAGTTPNFKYMSDIQSTQSLCNMLIKTPHYAKMGAEGIFAIVETANSLGIDPRQALGGGLYFVRGKVEMSSRMMNALIRSRRHSVTRDKKSNDEICILHGKRSDNGDTWTESFSLEEAKKAGLTRSPVWQNFTRDMLFARALSRLARQLFPDVIGNCYVEGEISLDPNISNPVVEEVQETSYGLSEEQCQTIDKWIEEVPAMQDFLKMKFKVGEIAEIPSERYEEAIALLRRSYAKKKKAEAQDGDR